ncbi:MAG TPA: hypothetical protein P5531_03000 [Bacteroidales bacterium]|nr:hypothetical protein [Bacteroidales bacterium]HSA42513.1 hypothetical protein [Bacteroidales bacterium]
MFSPIHRFQNCQRLQRWFEANRDTGNIPVAILQGYNRYHYALLHKLKSAKYHYSNLVAVVEETEATEMLANSESFLQQVNMHLDGFFYCSGSALDILAREILIYFNIPLPGRVYYNTAGEQLNIQRPADPLLARLNDPQWKAEFSDYRNALTHEVLIARNYNINVNDNGMNQQISVVFSMPDDPRTDFTARTFRRNPNGLEYCQLTFQRILSHINQIYGEIEQRTRNTGMPL